MRVSQDIVVLGKDESCENDLRLVGREFQREGGVAEGTWCSDLSRGEGKKGEKSGEREYQK